MLVNSVVTLRVRIAAASLANPSETAAAVALTAWGIASAASLGSRASRPTRIDDATGELVVYVPRAADPFWLLRFGDDFELDVHRFPAGASVEPPFDANGFDAIARAVRDV